MDYKPDESTLISWLFGELDEKEHKRVEQYLMDHPAERAKLNEMTAALQIVGQLKDKEIITPPVFMDDHGVRSLWSRTWFQTIAAIAASFLLLMVAGRLIGMEINYSSGELRISFGQKQETPVKDSNGLTASTVQEMINSSLNKNNETFAVDQQRRVDESIRQGADLNSKKIDDVMRRASQASQLQLRGFIAGLQQDNLRLMKDYLQLSSTEQKKYVEGLLVDFSKYLQDQRNQDMNLFQVRMNNIEKNSEQFKQDTEQILSGLISTASLNTKKNNY